MWKKVLLLVFIGASSLFAKEQKEIPAYPGGFTLGLCTSSSVTPIEYFLTVGYIHQYFLFDFGANYQYIDIPTTGDVNIFNFFADLGLRNRLCRNLFVTYGVGGSREVAVHKLPTEFAIEYNVGAFTGLDLQIVRHFLISGKIYLFDFLRDFNRLKWYRSFVSGTLNLAYVF